MSEAPENASATQPEPSLNWYQRAASWCSTNATWLVSACAIFALILILIVVKQTVELHGQYTETNWGNVAEAFGAAGTLLAVVVALWQSLVIRPQAEQARTDAAEQFEKELISARVPLQLFRAACLAANLSETDTKALADHLAKRQAGKRLTVHRSRKGTNLDWVLQSQDDPEPDADIGNPSETGERR